MCTSRTSHRNRRGTLGACIFSLSAYSAPETPFSSICRPVSIPTLTAATFGAEGLISLPRLGERGFRGVSALLPGREQANG